MKQNYIILIVMLGFLLFSEEIPPAKKTTYLFHAGSTLLLNPSPHRKEIKPILTLVQANGSTEFTFPVGAHIWKDQSESGYLIIRYMDKRFSAFGSDAYELVDMERKTIIPIVTDVIAEIDAHRDDILIGVQRIANQAHLIRVDLGYDYKLNDWDYHESVNVLFIIKFDFKIGRFYRINVISGPHLPDWNLTLGADLEQDNKLRRMAYVKNNTLYYSMDSDEKIVLQFKLPDADFRYTSVEQSIKLK